MANRIDIKHNLPSDQGLARMFDAVPQLRKHDVMNAVLRSGSKVVVDRAKKEAPRGRPEDRRKRSKSQRAQYDWENPPLWRTVTRVIRGGKRAKRSAIAIIGPRFPDGNKAYFNQPRAKKRRHVLWGRDVGRTYIVARNWLAIAFDSTRAQQLSAMKSTMRTKLNEMWLHV